MHRFAFVLIALLIGTSAQAALPGDGAKGQRVHDASCKGCHGTEVYSRKDRRIRSLDALHSQLEACSHAAQKQFSSEEKQNLVKYLNDQFYKFK